jgi:hypothetical protein
VNEPVGVEVTVLYLSVSFHPEDLDVIKPAVLAFLKSSLDGRPLIVMFGHPDATVAILCPHVACFSCVDGMAIRTSSDVEFDDLPAPILLSDDVAALNISRFIFAPEQTKGVAATLQRIVQVGGAVPIDRVLTSAALVSKGLPLSPVHMIAIVPRVGSIADRLPSFQSALVRIDFLTPVFDDFTDHARRTAAGAVLVFTRHNLLKNLRSLTAARSIYQNYMLARAAGVATAWRPLPSPACYDESGRHFAPVLPDVRQPFVLDLRIAGRATAAVVQVTAKMITFCPRTQRHHTVVRALTRRFELSDVPADVVKSVDPPVLLWLWLTRTLAESPRNVVAGLFRATAAVIRYLDPADQRAALLRSACCALKFTDLAADAGQVAANARYALCLRAPHDIAISPRWDAATKVAVCGNSVYTDDRANQDALKEYYAIPLAARMQTPVPGWCVEVDPAGAQFLDSLLKD